MDGFDFSKFNRIILIGCMGSGKSWLSKRIAEITNYPLYHLDVEHWQPGWVKHSKDEQIARQKELISGEKWIIDGTWGGTMEIRYAAADLIIYLDINRLLCMWSAAKRTGKKRSDLPDYLEEKNIFSKEFFQFCKWIWIFPKDNKQRIMNLREKYPEKEFLCIKSRREVRKLLKNRNI
jgi:Adenylate kinase and related kinases